MIFLLCSLLRLYIRAHLFIRQNNYFSAYTLPDPIRALRARATSHVRWPPSLHYVSSQVSVAQRRHRHVPPLRRVQSDWYRFTKVPPWLKPTSTGYMHLHVCSLLDCHLVTHTWLIIMYLDNQTMQGVKPLMFWDNPMSVISLRYYDFYHICVNPVSCCMLFLCLSYRLFAVLLLGIWYSLIIQNHLGLA